MAVAQNIYVVKWFKGKELNTVFGVQLSFARCVSMTLLSVLHLSFAFIFIINHIIMTFYIRDVQAPVLQVFKVMTSHHKKFPTEFEVLSLI